MQLAGLNEKEDRLSLSSEECEYRLVLLHGWGADAEDLVPLGNQINDLCACKFELVWLRAPEIHPDGLGRQWYGLYPPDWQAVPKAVWDLEVRLKEIATEKIPISRTSVLGFSQGGAMAIATGCSLPLAGVIGCSAYPHQDWNPPSKIPRIHLFHGKEDQVVPSLAAQEIIKRLDRKNNDVNLTLFDGGHQIPQYLIPQICNFLELSFI